MPDDEEITVPPPTSRVAPLAESDDLDDLLDEDGNIR